MGKVAKGPRTAVRRDIDSNYMRGAHRLKLDFDALTCRLVVISHSFKNLFFLILRSFGKQKMDWRHVGTERAGRLTR